MPARPPRGPDCGSANVRPIVYGEPALSLALQARRGELVIGGCVIMENSPDWDCADCRRQFGESLGKQSETAGR